MSNVIRDYLKKEFHTASDETYGHIDEWLEWYQGDVGKFHVYSVYNGVSVTKHRRYSMGMAKKVCEDWANLLLSEKVSIKAGRYEKRQGEPAGRAGFRTWDWCLCRIPGGGWRDHH